MFKRISRLIQSFFNQFLTAAEDPVMILENNIRELQSQVPKLNEAVAKSYGSVIMLQKQLTKYIDESLNLDSQVKAALKLQEEGAARNLVMQLQSVKEKETKLSEDLKLSQQNLQQTTELRDLKIEEIQTKIKEIKGAIEEHKFSQMQREIAEVTDASASIDVDSVSQSTDEMLNKLNQKTSLNQGVFASSISNSAPALQSAKIQKEAKQIQADEILLEYKKQMGLEKETVDSE
jgi:phage shock protein A